MKTLNCLFLLLVLSLSVYAGDVDERRHIEVSGTAKIMVDPDVVVWRIEMQGVAGSIDAASAELEETVIGLKKAMGEAGFEKEIIKLNAVSSGRIYEGHGQKRVFKGFYAKKSATIELKKLADRGSLEKALLKDDRVRLLSTVAKSSKEDELKRKALLLAVKDSKEKAMQMADALGSRIGVALSITEQGGHQSYRNESVKMMRSSDQGSSSLPSESITYYANVLVKFDLQ